MAQAEQKRSLFGSRSKGKRFTFEGKNIETERLVRGEVVAKDEEEARKNSNAEAFVLYVSAKSKPHANAVLHKKTSRCLRANWQR